jgi:carbonic anhydrase
MGVIDELILNNHQFARRRDHRHLDVSPARRLAVVTCMDSRLDVFAALGLEPGEAHVIRNAGGVITDDVVRSLALSQLRLGTREILVIHHTDCGLEKVTDDSFRAELHQLSGMAPSFAIESFTHPEENLRQSIRRVRSSPFIPHAEGVRGFIYDVDTGQLVEVRP